MDYGYLREQYPAVISKDQLYRICHISKRKAVWLLEHGVIPCEDPGKQTVISAALYSKKTASECSGAV